jgi:hypothetical protein
MIKILIVIEEEDGVDFRAYSLQITDRPTDLNPRVKMRMIENEDKQAADKAARRPQTGFLDNCRYTTPQSGSSLETRQIFMN